MYIPVDTSLLWFLFFFQTSKLHVFIKLHRNCQLLISLEQSKTPSMLINFEECDCQHIKIQNVKSLSSMYSVGKCINSSRFIITTCTKCDAWSRHGNQAVTRRKNSSWPGGRSIHGHMTNQASNGTSNRHVIFKWVQLVFRPGVKFA